MFTVIPRASGSAAIGDLLVLSDARSKSEVTLAPTRGALVRSMRAFDREVFYLDPTTLLDVSKNVRGGNPVLFPSPGKLDGDAWAWGGKRGAMKQHGFARNLPWSIEATATHDAAAVTLLLVSSDATRAQYPWDFRARFTFALASARLRIEQQIENTSREPLPYGLGFHPYFQVTDKSRARIDTRATRAFDNVAKRTGPFSGFDLTQPEVDVHLLDHGSTESALHLGDGFSIHLRASAEFTQWVIWTLGGKDFVCVEPWTCAGNALTTGDRLIVLAPGESRATWFEIELAPSLE